MAAFFTYPAIVLSFTEIIMHRGICAEMKKLCSLDVNCWEITKKRFYLQELLNCVSAFDTWNTAIEITVASCWRRRSVS